MGEGMGVREIKIGSAAGLDVRHESYFTHYHSKRTMSG
jgi:hypothetical protein